MRPLAPLSSAALRAGVVVVLLAGCASGGQGGPGGPGAARRQAGADTIPAAAPNTTAHADLRDANGNAIGTVTLTQTRHGVLVTGDLTSLPPGVHAIHVHDTGRCEAPFTSAGGHFSPVPHTHGFKSQMGPHAGDLPNFSVAANGTGHVEALSRELTLAPGPVGPFGPVGASIIVHAGPDDYASDPAGNSGPRIACGVITR
jgi:Cu-Zn family superoxide dismutase